MADNLKIDMSKYTHIDDDGNIIQPQSGGVLNSIVNSAPMNALLGFGDATGNFVRGALHLAGKPFGTSFDPATLIQQNRNPQGDLQFQPMQSSKGGAYNVGNIAGDFATALTGGELLAPLKLGQMAESLPGILKSAPQIAGWSALGAVGNPNNLQKGLAEGAIGGAIGESVAPAFRGIGKLADYLSEKFYPEKFSKELVDKLRENYSTTEQTATDMYDSVLDKYKKNYPVNFMFDPKKVLQDEINISELPDLGILYKQYLKYPTPYNAHILKSKMGESIYNLRDFPSNALDKAKANILEEHKNNLENFMMDFLNKKNPNDASLYREASDYFRDNLVPYRENKKLYDIVSSNTREIDPSDLSKALADVSNQTKVPENHYIAQANEELEKRLFGGKILGKALQKTPGGQMIAPGMASILSSPTIRGFASNTQPYADKLKTLMLANLLQGNQ